MGKDPDFSFGMRMIYTNIFIYPTYNRFRILSVGMFLLEEDYLILSDNKF